VATESPSERQAPKPEIATPRSVNRRWLWIGGIGCGALLLACACAGISIAVYFVIAGSEAGELDEPIDSIEVREVVTPSPEPSPPPESTPTPDIAALERQFLDEFEDLALAKLDSRQQSDGLAGLIDLDNPLWVHPVMSDVSPRRPRRRS
jgi:hypothetical protein